MADRWDTAKPTIERRDCTARMTACSFGAFKERLVVAKSAWPRRAREKVSVVALEGSRLTVKATVLQGRNAIAIERVDTTVWMHIQASS